MTPKARRLHLVESHDYPTEFFFAITNKGVGGLLERWGEGVSLVRGKWKDRSSSSDSTAAEKKSGARTSDDAMSTDDEGDKPVRAQNPSAISSKTQDPIPADAQSLRAKTAPPETSAKRDNSPLNMKPRSVAQKASKPLQTKAAPPQKTTDAKTGQTEDDAMDGLTSTLTALSLVPRSVHFGRSKTAGFGHR